MSRSEIGQNFDDNIKDDASSVVVGHDIGGSRQSVITSQQRQGNKENPKSLLNTSKRVTTKPKQVKAPSNYDPQQFIRRIVYKECNGEKILGSVHYYDAKKEMFYVEYDDDEGKFVTMNDLLNNLATEKEINSQQTEVSSVRRKGNVEKPKSKLNSSKRVTTKPTKGKEATPSYNPRQFIRRIVYKECNEEKILGSVHYYDPTKQMFYVEYEDGEGKFVGKNELLSKLATDKEVFEAQGISPPCSKKTAEAEKKRSISGAGSTPTKKRNTSGQKM